MTEMSDLVSHLYDQITQAGSLTDADWLRFKDEHRMPPEQCEQVLVQTIQHLCRLCADTTAEANRLSHALASRRG